MAWLTKTNFLYLFLCQVDATNLLGNTPLHIACLNGQDIVITELISYGASVNATNKKGMVSGIYSTYSCNAIKQCPTVSWGWREGYSLTLYIHAGMCGPY